VQKVTFVFNLYFFPDYKDMVTLDKAESIYNCSVDQEVPELLLQSDNSYFVINGVTLVGLRLIHQDHQVYGLIDRFILEPSRSIFDTVRNIDDDIVAACASDDVDEMWPLSDFAFLPDQKDSIIKALIKAKFKIVKDKSKVTVEPKDTKESNIKVVVDNGNAPEPARRSDTVVTLKRPTNKKE